MKYTPITQKPKKLGQYPIHIHGVRSSLPVYLDFDGENWIGLDEIVESEAEGNIDNVVYLNTPSPLGFHKPQFIF
jgi:hypothetical protein